MTESQTESSGRRPIASRGWAPIVRVADWLIARRVSPNAISVASVLFAALACTAFAMTTHAETDAVRRAWWILAAAGIQARLLANLFDGMVALGRGVASPLGDLYNEIPDRISDPLILIGAGFAVGGCPILGLGAAVSALLIACVRAFGVVAGADHVFLGPMAKPQRMFVVTLAAIWGAATPDAWQPTHEATGIGVLGAALALVVVGGVITVVRRLRAIAAQLRDRSAQ